MLSDFIVAKLEEIIRIYKAKRLPVKIYFPIGPFSLLLKVLNVEANRIIFSDISEITERILHILFTHRSADGSAATQFRNRK